MTPDIELENNRPTNLQSLGYVKAASYVCTENGHLSAGDRGSSIDILASTSSSQSLALKDLPDIWLFANHPNASMFTRSFNMLSKAK